MHFHLVTAAFIILNKPVQRRQPDMGVYYTFKLLELVLVFVPKGVSYLVADIISICICLVWVRYTYAIVNLILDTIIVCIKINYHCSV